MMVAEREGKKKRHVAEGEGRKEVSEPKNQMMVAESKGKRYRHVAE